MSHVLALLIGIDNYDPAGKVQPLRGCRADVQAMYQYLTRQLGLAAGDVRTLVDSAATRSAILDAWQTHLIAPATPGDQIFFYFSGHGSQTPSQNPEEPDALDETLVAYDSRTPGSYDILDKELAWLIGRAEARGAHVSVLLDCCHAGSGTRSDDQPLARRTAPLSGTVARPSLVAPFPELLAAARAPTAHVLLAAALDLELANEYREPGGGTWYGAVTWFFLETLRSRGPQLTWADLHDAVVARVHTIYPAQTPQLDGPTSRLFLGGIATPVRGYLRVLAAPPSGMLQVDGGLALGVQPGARLALYPPGSELDGSPQALALVEAATPTSCQARLEQPAVVAPGSRATVQSYGQDAMVHAVTVADDAVAEAVLKLRNGEPSPVLALTQPGTGHIPDLSVRKTPAEYRIEDSTGALLASLPAGGSDAAQKVARALEHLAVFRNVLALRNHHAAPALQGAIAVEGPYPVGGKPLGEATTVVAAGQTIGLQLTNTWRERLFVAVFRLDSDYSVRRIKPERERVATLAPGRMAALRILDRPRLAAGQPRARIVYKIFVLRDAADLDVLQLPPLGRPAAQAAASRTRSALAVLLDAVRSPGTRRLRADDGPGDRWLTHERELWVEAGRGTGTAG